MAGVPSAGDPPTHAAVLDQVDLAVISTDSGGVITTWNNRAATLYGWSPEEAIGRSISDLLVPEGEKAAAREIVATLSDGRPRQGSLKLRRRDGSVLTAFVRSSPLLDEAGRLIGIVGASFELGDRQLADAVRAVAAVAQRDGRRTRVLSPREREILGLLARGLTGEQIAERLVLSPETIRTHIRNAREKLGASTRVEAVTMALLANEIQL